jgi:general secretion pathway protein A
MYLSHFDLKEKPFQISPDPKFLWLGETHKEALAALQYGISENRGFLLLAGDVGTGKTTLINEFLDNLDENTQVAIIPDPGVEKLDFYNFLIHAFDIEKTFTSKGDFLVHFIHFLHKSHAGGKKVLIIIDEAQRLRHEMLEEIRQLSNIEKKDTKLLNVFLIGQHELVDALNEIRNRALLQRITTKYLLGPIKKTDVSDYIEFRLHVAGTEKKLFSSGAIRQIISFTGCYPRLINVVCDHALLTAFVKGKKKVDANIIKDCIKDLEIPVEKPKDEIIDSGVFRSIITAVRAILVHPVFRISIYSTLIILILFSFLFFFLPSNINLLPHPFRKAIQKTDKRMPAVQPKSMAKKSQQIVPSPQAVSSKQEPGLPSSDLVENLKAGPESKAVAPDKPAPPFKTKKFIVQFPLDSNEFSSDTYALLDQIVDLVSQYDGLKINISGHTDSLGNYTYNKRLSEFRANVVKSYFVGQGINPRQISAKGLGPDQPVASNNTQEGRRANRRVEILLTPISQ